MAYTGQCMTQHLFIFGIGMQAIGTWQIGNPDLIPTKGFEFALQAFYGDPGKLPTF